MTQENYIYDPRTHTDFAVSGKTENRTGLNYTENEFSALVNYKEHIENGMIQFVDFKIPFFKQSNQGLACKLAEDLLKITDTLQLKLDYKHTVNEVLNLTQLHTKYLEQKPKLIEKYKQIPDFDKLLDNYEQNLQNEEKVRKSLFYKGIHALFFPRIKEYIDKNRTEEAFIRTRTFPNYLFSVDLPVKENFTYKRIGANYLVETQGGIDFEKLNKPKFLEACRMLFGKEVKLADISLKIHETYELNHKLNYEKGKLTHNFEVKGVHFNRESMHYVVKTPNDV